MTEAQAQAVVAEAERFGLTASLLQVCHGPHPDYGVEVLHPNASHGRVLAFSMDQLWHSLIYCLPPEQWAAIPPPGRIWRDHTGACVLCDTGKRCPAAGYWARYGGKSVRQVALFNVV